MSSKEINLFIEQVSKVTPKTLLVCPNCKEKLERDYKEKEYVNKEVEDKCPRCSTNMYVKSIYVLSKPSTAL